MTEIQRIKNEGWLTECFFLPEIRNEFLVSEDRKMIWAILLDLLVKFQDICKKHDLRYYAICGTALGAVRHKGFIPWDDDLDVAMPRGDYEKLKKLKEDFKAPYNLVWPEVELENGFSFIKLRNSNTTGMSMAFSNLKIDSGIYLDIFPLDEVREETYAIDQAEIKELILENSGRMKLMNGISEIERGRYIPDIVDTFRKIEKRAIRDNNGERDKLALRTISFYPIDRMIWNKRVFEEIIEVPFEEISINIPFGWKELLEINYGDWEKFPPVEDRGKWHSNVIFDPNKLYTEYQKG